MTARNSEKQIIAAIKRAGSGDKVEESDGGNAAQKLQDARYVHQLEEENRRLKLAVADLTLRNQALKSVVSKKW
jgi:hypothetical protein